MNSKNYIITTVDKFNLTRDIYNTSYTTLTPFELPAWAQRNVELSDEYLAKYGYERGTKYENIKVADKEKIRTEVFDIWIKGTWDVLRTNIGLKIDKIGYTRLTDGQKENIRLALSEQVNYWRTNLPWEVSATTSKVSGDYSITINATEWLTGYDSLSAKTKTFIRATGLLTIPASEIPELTEAESTLVNLQKDVKELQDETYTPMIPTNLITREEVVNGYWSKDKQILGYAELNEVYLKISDAENLGGGGGSGATTLTPGYYENETKEIRSGNYIKILQNSTNTLSFSETREPAKYTIDFNENGNKVQTILLNKDGIAVNDKILTTKEYVDNQFPTKAETYTQTEVDFKLQSYYTKAETYNQAAINNGDNALRNDYILRDTNLQSDYDTKIAALETEIRDEFHNKTNTYNRSEIDEKITTAVSAGKVDLGNYYNKQETDLKLEGNRNYTRNLFTKNSLLLVGNNAGSAATEAYIGDQFSGTQRYGQNATGDIIIGEGATKRIAVGSLSGNGELKDATGATTFQNIVKVANNDLLLNVKGLAGDNTEIGTQYEGAQYYGYNAKGAQEYGFLAEGNQSYGTRATGNLAIGSENWGVDGNTSKGTMVSGGESATFKEIIHKTKNVNHTGELTNLSVYNLNGTFKENRNYGQNGTNFLIEKGISLEFRASTGDGRFRRWTKPLEGIEVGDNVRITIELKLVTQVDNSTIDIECGHQNDATDYDLNKSIYENYHYYSFGATTITLSDYTNKNRGSAGDGALYSVNFFTTATQNLLNNGLVFIFKHALGKLIIKPGSVYYTVRTY